MKAKDIQKRLQEVSGNITKLILDVTEVEQSNPVEKETKKANFKTDLDIIIKALQEVKGQVDNL